MDKLLVEMTKGKSIIDMPDFKMLPVELQQAIVQYLAQGGNANFPDQQPPDAGGKKQEMELRQQNVKNQQAMNKNQE
jgi:hypothetical protein